MENLKFKTTIKCMGCLSKATPHLNESVGEDKWEVDINSNDKILTLSNVESIDPGKVIQAVEAAGYKAEIIQ